MSILFVFISTVIPPLGIPLGCIGICKDKYKWKQYVYCLAFAFAAAGYSYITSGKSDITRYFEYMDNMKFIPLSGVISYGKYGTQGEALYIFNFFCWLAVQINDYHIVPFLSCFIIYYISFYITCKMGLDGNVKGNTVLWGILFSIIALNFYSLVNNIRNVLAFTIVGFAVFREYYEKKHNVLTYLLYIVPIFIHSSVLPLILLRIVLPLAKKLKIVGVGVAVFIIPILNIVHPYTEQFKDGILRYIRKAVDMGYRYFNDLSAVEWGIEAQASGSETVFKIAYVAIMVIACLSLLMIMLKAGRKHQDKYGKSVDSNKKIKYLTYVFYIGLMGISCTPMPIPNYWRFSATMIALGSGVIPLSTKMNINRMARQLVWMALYLLGFICAILWMRNLYIHDSLFSVLVKPFYNSPAIMIPIHFLQSL